MSKKVVFAALGIAGCTIVAKVSFFIGAIWNSVQMAKDEDYRDKVIESAGELSENWEKFKEKHSLK